METSVIHWAKGDLVMILGLGWESIGIATVVKTPQIYGLDEPIKIRWEDPRPGRKRTEEVLQKFLE